MDTLKRSTLKEQVNGIEIIVGKNARLENLTRVILSEKQSNFFVKQVEREHLLEAYKEGHVQLAGVRAGEIFTDCVRPDQLKQIRDNSLVVISGISPGQKYTPISYASRNKRVVRVTDPCSLMGSLLIEAVNNVNDSTMVRIPGVHDAKDELHYISVIAQVKGHEKKLSSGAIADFGWHGDGDGFHLRLVDKITWIGQIHDGFNPTLYSSLDDVLKSIPVDSDEWKYIEILEKALFISEVPTFVGTRARNGLLESWARPVIRSDRTDLFIHPTTQVHHDIGGTLHARASTALGWFRMRLSETAIGISLAPFQILTIPNTLGKHAVWEKTVNGQQISRRQLLRGYSTLSVRKPGHHVITAPLL